MFRTRDFFLLSTIIAFLLLGIITTIDVKNNSGWLNNLRLLDNNTEYKAVVPELKISDREQKLEEMRKKVAESDETKYLANLISAVDEESESILSDVETESGLINKCTNYIDVKPVWSPLGLKFEIVEGARIIYRESLVEAPVGGGENFSNREVVAQLPLRSVSSGVNKCLSSEVVGIALDGSLINNSDYTAYRIFGSETLIGYALDGFPIYGLNSEIKVDGCGGVNVDGQYRYFLAEGREGMIGCFSSEPISL